MLSLVHSKNNEPDSASFQCSIKPKIVSVTGVHSPDAAFESEIVKTTDAEKVACKALEAPTDDSMYGDTSNNASDHELLRALSKKKRRVEKECKLYRNSNFILGSTAEMDQFEISHPR